jgi:glycosyltransferase involved in cell wall biosynthesis
MGSILEAMNLRTLRVSVCLTTRNRADHAFACVKTILANEGFDQLLVIDQSDGDQTEAAIATLYDARLRFIRTESRGVTRGRNLGAELAQGDVIAFTDDDCRVAPDWIPALTRIFANDPEVGVVCGRVRVAEAVKDLGFTMSFEPVEREWQGRYPPFDRDWGITANLAVRLDVLARAGAFDPMLGVGAPLRSGGEPDFLFRVLHDGFKVVNASEVSVDHLGVRKYGKESSKLVQGYAFGTGAALLKYVRMGDPAALRVYLHFAAGHVRRVCENLVRGKRPLHLLSLLFFLAGSLASYKYRVDRCSRLYMLR